MSGGKDCSIKLWNAATGECVRTLAGHSKPVNAVLAFSLRRFVSGGGDGQVVLWDTVSWVSVASFGGLCGEVYAIVKLSDNEIAVGGSEAVIQIWDLLYLNSPRCRVALSGHNKAVRCLVLVSERALVSGGDDSTVRVWDPIEGVCLRTLADSSLSLRRMYCMVGMPSISVLATGGGAGAWEG